MTGAGIDDGDLVIVWKEEQAQEGEIVVALINDGTTTPVSLILPTCWACPRTRQ